MTAGSYRVVFDTNILVSGHFWKGPPYRCMLAVESGLATLIMSGPILTEFSEKLTDKFGVSKAEVDSIVERWATRAELASIEGKAGWVPADPEDDKFIETALIGGAAIHCVGGSSPPRRRQGAGSRDPDRAAVFGASRSRRRRDIAATGATVCFRGAARAS